jgi:ubiquinone/menaquinone biosynthesis C-methylase UbiE
VAAVRIIASCVRVGKHCRRLVGRRISGKVRIRNGKHVMKSMLKPFMKKLWDDADAAYRKRLLSLFEANPNSKMLDLGCDDGEWTMEIAQRIGTANVFGVDLVEERYRKAVERGVEVRQADLNGRVPFEDATFEVVHSNQVIEHISDLDFFVEEIHRVLKPGGYAVICTENLASWHNVACLIVGLQPFSLTNISTTGALGNRFAYFDGHAPKAGLHQYKTFFHTRVLAYSAFKEVFAKHGFDVVACGGTGYHPLPGRAGGFFSRVDPAHSHFIYLKAKKI